MAYFQTRSEKPQRPIRQQYTGPLVHTSTDHPLYMPPSLQDPHVGLQKRAPPG